MTCELVFGVTCSFLCCEKSSPCARVPPHQEHRKKLEEFTLNYKDVVADVDEYKQMTVIKTELLQSITRMEDINKAESTDVVKAARSALAKVCWEISLFCVCFLM